MECGSRMLAAIVPKDKFVEINLELTAADAMMSSDQPLLQVANRAVRQRYNRFCAFAQIATQRLDARHVLESSFL